MSNYINARVGDTYKTLYPGDTVNIEGVDVFTIISIGGSDAAPSDPINPDHYKSHPSGVECITITEWMNFCLGNAVKYIWRAALKGGIEDLKKARWYLDREIAHLEGMDTDGNDATD